ncbi:MAG: OstA-like protein [Saprospiraceae bacterium]|nr:OstA-like protein [Saprospiraceae bacterium]
MRVRFLSFLLWWMLPALLWSQSDASSSQDTTQKIQVESSLFGEYFLKEGRYVQKLSGMVRLRHGNTLIFCDTALLDVNDARLTGNILIEQSDSLRLYGDSALYFGDRRVCDIFGDVVLVKGQQELFTNRLHYDFQTKMATYWEGGTMSNGKSQLTSTRGYYDVERKMVYLSGDVLVVDLEFNLRTDTLTYSTETQIVRFVAPTLITQRGSRLYCEGGFYDLEQNFAVFENNPQYEQDGQRGRAKKIRYNGARQEYVLEGDAFVEEPAQGRSVRADVIRYNAETEKAVFVGNVFYRDSAQTVSGAEVYYDRRTQQYQIRGRGRVSDPPYIIEADSLAFNQELGNGLALGNVEWRDTAEDYTLLAYRADYNRATSFVHAYGAFGDEGPEGRPLMLSRMEGDTLYLSADTLISFRPDTTTDNRTFLAYRDVRIFNQDLQAACDSLAYHAADSMFYFFKKERLPVLWADTSQFSADTLLLRLRNNRISEMRLRENTLVVQSEDARMYNQIKGRLNTVFFEENEAREMHVEGNAEALYYVVDDAGRYMGLNKSESAEMRLYFEERRVVGVKLYGEPQGKLSPMRQVGLTETQKLDGFFWEMQRRPRSVEDLLTKPNIRAEPE